MTPKRILIVSDAWEPQVNGVVRTLRATIDELERRGHSITLVTPCLFRSVPCPTYPEIRLAIARPATVEMHLEQAKADAIHIATEGPLGLITRRWCQRSGLPFTTSYHTQFPDYVAARTPFSPATIWKYVRWFHGPATQILTATPSLRAQLHQQGLTNLSEWSRGVDHQLFRPDLPKHPAFKNLPKPEALYVGRIAVEKSVEDFLSLDLPGSKVVVGDGPARSDLEQEFPDAHFLGAMQGEMLARAYASADAFIFPSKTDTFGLVLIEAMACGTPIAAYPVMGPIDIVTPASGVLSDNLTDAVHAALKLDRNGVTGAARTYNWERATDQFLAALRPFEIKGLTQTALCVA